MKRWLCLVMVLAFLPLGGAWAQETTPDDNYRNWYEIFVYSYQDSDGDGIGDLPGLLSRLDYLAQMGYTGLWLMPVMPSPSYHKYDVKDYYAIDPAYGTMDDMRAVVEGCHARGIKLIIDMPLNHTSTRHPWFLEACDALRKGQDSPYIDYYRFTQEPWAGDVQLSGTHWYYEEQFAGGGMPDLNLENPTVEEEIQKIFSFWLCDVGVDGFRLDAVTSYFTQDAPRNIAFLRKLKYMAEELKPGSYLVGEAWTGLTDIAMYYESGVDSFFLFPASQAEGYIARVVRDRKPAAAYVKYMQQVMDAIPEGMWAPFLGNHDTGRAIGSLQARKAPAKAKFAEAILNLMGGSTFTYYGEEIGMVGSGEDPNKRLAMYWNEEDMTRQPPGVTKIEYAYPCVDDQLADPASLLNYLKALNHLKLAVPSIARGSTEFVYSDSFLCVMKRTWESETSYVVINFSSAKTLAYRLDVPGLALAGTLLTGEEEAAVNLEENGADVTLPPYGICVLVAR